MVRIGIVVVAGITIVTVIEASGDIITGYVGKIIVALHEFSSATTMPTTPTIT